MFLVIQMANEPMKMLNSTNHLERTKQNKQKKNQTKNLIRRHLTLIMTLRKEEKIRSVSEDVEKVPMHCGQLENKTIKVYIQASRILENKQCL